ncbi:MAG: LysM peptidoglycan-binding domain-containing protein [Propionicimonas sp.]
MRWLRGLGALIALVGVLVGAPPLLLAWGRVHPWTWAPGFDDGSLLLAVLTIAGWIAWVAFTLATLLEVVRLLSRNRFVVNLPLLGGLQGVCAGLVIAVVALAASGPSAPEAAPGIAGVEVGHQTTSSQATGTPPPAQRDSETPAAGSSDRGAGATQRLVRPPETTSNSYVVSTGDDLWSIAATQLGQGRRWREIAEANPRTLADPTTDLVPGTTLQIPSGRQVPSGRQIPSGGGDADAVTSASPAPRRVVVKPGDTLSGLAEEHLDEAARWQDIARANRSIVADPDHIEVGWRLTLPSDAVGAGTGRPGTPSNAANRAAPAADPAEPAAPASENGKATEVDSSAPSDEGAPTRDEAAERVGTARVPGTASTSPVGSPEPVASAQSSVGPHLEVPERSAGATVDPASDTVLIGSLSGLAAAGLVGGWQSRRLLQHRTRAPGRRVLQPDEELLRFHSALGRAQRPDHSSALDAALRAIARHHHRAATPLAPLADAVLEPDAIVFHWAEPAGPPPRPFGGSDAAWRLLLDDASLLPQDAADPVAFPALVSLGAGAEGETVLVDVERSGVLGVAADHPELQHATIAAMAVELACASWAAEVTVIVAGGDDRLVRAAGGERVETLANCESALVRIRRRQTERAAALGSDELRQLRVDPDRAEAVAPEVYVFTDPVDRAALDELDGLLAGRPLGLAAILAVAADAPATWQVSGDALRPTGVWPGSAPLRAQAIPAATRAAVADLFGVADSPETTPAPWWSGDRASNVRPLPLREPEIEDTVDIVRLRRREPTRPTLLLLGPVELVGATGSEPARSRSQLLEMCGWLLEHPQRTASQMATAMAVAEGTRRSNMSRLRSWLGQDPGGKPYLPDAYSGRISLHEDVTSDAQAVRLLAGPGVDKVSEGSLTAILELVRGAVLADVAPGQWFWAEELRSDLESTVRDVAVVLAGRALERGDLDLARWAVQRALVAAPDDELLLAAWIRAEHAAGNASVVQRLVSRLTLQARILGIDLMPDTVLLCQHVVEGAYRARRA